MRRLFAWMEEVAVRGGFPGPVLLSECRSPERTRELQRMWDAGMREGLAVRPSSNSRHHPDPFGVCHAFDLANDFLWLESMGPVVLQSWTGIEWGGTYVPRDVRHFEER